MADMNAPYINTNPYLSPVYSAYYSNSTPQNTIYTTENGSMYTHVPYITTGNILMPEYIPNISTNSNKTINLITTRRTLNNVISKKNKSNKVRVFISIFVIGILILLSTFFWWLKYYHKN